MVSRIRQNFKEESEALINKQINMEFYASYVYMSMFTYFDRDDVAYPGLAAFFKKSSDEEREHGEKLIKYQNKRGGKVVFQDIAKPSSMEWGSPVDALEAALELEKTVSCILETCRPLKSFFHLRLIRVFLTCTRHLMVMLIFATFSRASSLTSRWMPSKRSPALLQSGREPDLG